MVLLQGLPHFIEMWRPKLSLVLWKVLLLLITYLMGRPLSHNMLQDNYCLLVLVKIPQILPVLIMPLPVYFWGL